MIYKFYKCQYCDYLTSFIVVAAGYIFRENLSINPDLIKTILTFTGTLCGFLLTSISLLTALWNQDSMKMVREATDSEQIYYLPLKTLKRGIFLICILTIGLFAGNLNRNTLFILLNIFFLTQFIMIFLRFLFLLKTIFQWVLSYKS
jgi:hypothetical protein